MIIIIDHSHYHQSLRKHHCLYHFQNNGKNHDYDNSQVGFTANSKFFWQFTSCHQVLYGDGDAGGGNDDDDFYAVYIFKYSLKLPAMSHWLDLINFPDKQS